jgi:hypothetical protein
MDTYDDRSIGGTNLLPAGNNYHDTFHGARHVDWSEPGLKVTRFRIISDPGFPLWDVSYCHGYLNGEPVHVDLPFSQLRKHGFRYKDPKTGEIKKGGWKAHVIAWGKKEEVNVYKLGILQNVSTLN